MVLASERAKSLRKTPTGAEKAFWQKVRNRQLACKFYRQMPVMGFVVDFACPELILAIEIDGSQHAENPYDAVRTGILEEAGYRVIRYWNNEVMENMNGVLQNLQSVIEERKQSPLPPRGRGLR